MIIDFNNFWHINYFTLTGYCTNYFTLCNNLSIIKFKYIPVYINWFIKNILFYPFFAAVITAESNRCFFLTKFAIIFYNLRNPPNFFLTNQNRCFFLTKFLTKLFRDLVCLALVNLVSWKKLMDLVNPVVWIDWIEGYISKIVAYKSTAGSVRYLPTAVLSQSLPSQPSCLWALWGIIFVPKLFLSSITAVVNDKVSMSHICPWSWKLYKNRTSLFHNGKLTTSSRGSRSNFSSKRLSQDGFHLDGPKYLTSQSGSSNL